MRKLSFLKNTIIMNCLGEKHGEIGQNAKY
jgi:hypothetical protein